MNNKEFIQQLTQQTGLPIEKTSSMTAAFIAEMTENLQEETTITIQNFGSFEVRKKQERVIVSPTTHQHMLVPPKLTINFRPSTTLKEKMQ